MDNSTLKQLKNFKILCVEDEYGIRKRLVNTLGYYFGEVIEASNSEEGLDRFYEKKPDIILSDIEMPDENGIEMVRKIREINIDVPIVMVTAYSNEEYLLRLINLNINYYILKPVNSENLLGGILKALGKRLKRNLDFGFGLHFDTYKREMLYHDKELPLRKREKDFLVLLHEHNGGITTYDKIEERLWQGRRMSKGALKTFVKELRSKLPADIIENIPLEGYRLKKESHQKLT